MDDLAYVISKENVNSLEGRPFKVIIGDEEKARDLIKELNETAYTRWLSEGMVDKLPHYFFDRVDIVK